MDKNTCECCRLYRNRSCSGKEHAPQCKSIIYNVWSCVDSCVGCLMTYDEECLELSMIPAGTWDERTEDTDLYTEDDSTVPTDTEGIIPYGN